MVNNVKIYYYTLNRADNTLREETIEAIEGYHAYGAPKGEYGRVWYRKGKNFYKSKMNKFNNIFGIKVELYSLKEVLNKSDLLLAFQLFEDKRYEIQSISEKFEARIIQ